jgi:hypothetical protein
LRSLRPIAGFGPFGWVAAAVLAALIIAVAVGIDFELLVVSAFGQVGGSRGVDFYMKWMRIPGWLLFIWPGFTLVAFLYTVVGFHLAPIRFGWFAWTTLLLWATLHTTGPWLLVKDSLLEAIQGSPLASGVDTKSLIATELFLEIPTPLILLCISRSIKLAAAVAALLVLTSAYELSINAAPTQPSGWLSANPAWLGVLWNVALASIIWSWAIHRRLAASRLSATACPACGFDLVNSPARCPECGRLSQHA